MRRPSAPVQVDHRADLRASFDDLQDGRFAAARDRLLPIMRGSFQEQDLETRLVFGLALAGAGDALSAAPLLNGIAAERPGTLHPCVDLVTLLHKRQRGRDAEPAFQACLALTPADSRLRLRLAQLLYELHRFGDALAEIDESLLHDPKLIPSMNQRAIILAALGRYDEALACFRQIAATDPGHAAAWANIGITLAAKGDFEEALSAYRRSIQIKPAEAQV
ncbi:MAG: tetratricopeptide repeat protein, partial [Janthinobacterium lividum]